MSDIQIPTEQELRSAVWALDYPKLIDIMQRLVVIGQLGKFVQYEQTYYSVLEHVDRALREMDAQRERLDRLRSGLAALRDGGMDGAAECNLCGYYVINRYDYREKHLKEAHNIGNFPSVNYQKTLFRDLKEELRELKDVYR